MGIKEYLAEKKEKLDNFRAKQEIKREQRKKTERLKAQLDRESLMEDAKSARAELKELKKETRAKKDIAKLEAFKGTKQKKSGFVQDFSTNFNSGLDNAFNFNMEKSNSGNLFGGQDLMNFSGKKKKKKGGGLFDL